MSHDESFFREVSEDLRNERFKQLWSRFGLYIIALAVLLLIALGAWVGYGYWSHQQAAQSGDRFLAAMKLADGSKPKQALDDLQAVEKSGFGDYPALARMRIASLRADQGDSKAAIDAFEKIGQDTGIPQAIRDAARVRAGYLLVDHGTYGQVADQVQPLAGAEEPFRHSAREVLGLAAWKAGNIEQAKKWFDMITSDTAAPRSVAARAQTMLDLIQAGDKPEKQS